MDCYICGSENEVENLSLYTHGSEGTDLCLSCRIMLTNVINGCVSIAATAKKAGFKIGRGIKDMKPSESCTEVQIKAIHSIMLVTELSFAYLVYHSLKSDPAHRIKIVEDLSYDEAEAVIKYGNALEKG